MENIKVEIVNDGKEKWQSWELNIEITIKNFNNDGYSSYLGGGFNLYGDLYINMYDDNYNDLKLNSYKELERLKENGYINSKQLEIIKDKINKYE